MGLKPGTYLGQYEVLALLGVGGMGEVYHAKDSKLNREVALKVLPEQFARDPERIGRFRREAQLLAQLHHENIALLYSFEETGSARFLVMEYVPGETLRERIQRAHPSRDRERAAPQASPTPSSPLPTPHSLLPGIPLEEALTICRQVADALEAAHEKTIVHRDLKPANVKITPEGVVKVLDFGLAKMFLEDGGSTDPADSPTLSAMTQPGTILGTAAYMAPEQARGKKVDKRADTWALGCLLYELLTGKWAFQSPDRKGGDKFPHQSPDRKRGDKFSHQSPERKRGDKGPVAHASGSDATTIADIFGAILHKEPDWDALPAETPANIRQLLRRCLQKDRTQRLHAAGDARIEIEQALREPEAVASVVAPIPPTANRRQLTMWSAFSALIAAMIVGAAAWTFLRPEPPPPPSPKRFVMNLPETDRVDTGGLALSPDGKTLVYIGIRGGVQQLYRRSMDQLEAVPIPGTEDAMVPFFSPDGQWVGFFTTDKLKKVALAGGPAATLSDIAANRSGASWGQDDTIVFSFVGSGLLRVPAAGGAPQTVTQLQADQGEGAHRWPDILPGGQAVLFTVAGGAGDLSASRIAVLDLNTGRHRILLDGSHPRFLPTGHIVFVRPDSLWAVPFDPVRLELSGSPAPLLEDLQVNPGGLANYAVAEDGSLVYLPRTEGFERRLVWVDRKGALEPLGAPARGYEEPRLSPDGHRLAVTINEENRDIWIFELARQTLTRLTFDPLIDEAPAWSPDGKWVAFARVRTGNDTLLRKLADSSGMEEELVKVEGRSRPASWSPDGKVLAFDMDPPGTRDIWLLPLEENPGQARGRVATAFIRTPFAESDAKFSPDGLWIAYASNESGQNEVYVQPYPGPGGKWQISSGGGEQPVWARNGRELFYRNGDRMMVVDVTTQPTFAAGSPKVLFEGQYWTPGPQSLAQYDVSPDGQRFLMIQPVEREGGPGQIHVVLNWFEELKRRVPAR